MLILANFLQSQMLDSFLIEFTGSKSHWPPFRLEKLSFQLFLKSPKTRFDLAATYGEFETIRPFKRQKIHDSINFFN